MQDKIDTQNQRDLLLIDPNVTYVDLLSASDVVRRIPRTGGGGGQHSRPSSRGRRGIIAAAHSTLWPCHVSLFFQVYDTIPPSTSGSEEGGGSPGRSGAALFGPRGGEGTGEQHDEPIRGGSFHRTSCPRHVRPRRLERLCAKRDKASHIFCSRLPLLCLVIVR